MYNKKHERGITLLALIVTVIVLIILASVTIGLIVGDNGIINKSQNAADEYEKVSQNEVASLEESTDEIRNILNGVNVSAEGDFDIDISYTTETISVKINENNLNDNTEYEYFVNKESKGKTKEKEMTININLQNKNPYIPEGFEYYEGDINTGYVIKDTSNGNEFVWVPMKSGKFNVYVEATTEDGKKSKSDEKEIQISELTREPKYTDLRYTDWYENEGDVTDKKSVAYFKKSVAENAGFYMGRYEMGMPGQKSGEAPVLDIDERNITGVPVCIPRVIPWTNIDYSKAKDNLESMYNGEVQSAMMNSYARVSTLNWIHETSGINYFGNYENVTGNTEEHLYVKGHFEKQDLYEKSFTLDDYEDAWYIINGWAGGVSGMLLETCADIQGGNRFVNNNIYDLGGNAGEWMTEIYISGNGHRITGGNCTNYSLAHPIVDSNVSFVTYGLNAEFYTSSRPILYK